MMGNGAAFLASLQGLKALVQNNEVRYAGAAGISSPFTTTCAQFPPQIPEGNWAQVKKYSLDWEVIKVRASHQRPCRQRDTGFPW